MYSSFRRNNITVVKLKASPKQRGIKGFYKLREDELIKKLEVRADVNEPILILGLEIPRNTTQDQDYQRNS